MILFFWGGKESIWCLHSGHSEPRGADFQHLPLLLGAPGLPHTGRAGLLPVRL